MLKAKSAGSLASDDVVAIFCSYTSEEWHGILLHHHSLEVEPGGAVLIRAQTTFLFEWDGHGRRRSDGSLFSSCETILLDGWMSFTRGSSRSEVAAEAEGGVGR